MADTRAVRIFLSSPGDVPYERRLVRSIVEGLGYSDSLRERVTLEVVSWDDPDSPAAMFLSMPPQQAIDLGLSRPADCDIVLIIFWSKLGSPLDFDGQHYESGTHFEMMDGVRAAEANGGYPPFVLFYKKTEPVTITLDDPNRSAKTEQFDRLNAFLKGDFFLADSGRRFLRGTHSYASIDQFRRDVESHLKQTIELVLTRPLPQKVASRSDAASALPLWQGSPFPGLRAFTEADEPIYFGRSGETADVIRLLAERRFVAIVGASGSGKSSLVGAGIIPKLRADVIPGSRDWVIVRFTPGELGADPLIALADRTIKVVQTPYADPEELARALAADPAALDGMVNAVLADRAAGAELLFFVDQFEELITVAGDVARADAIAVLERLAAHPRARVLITLRADFTDRVIAIEPLAHLLNEGLYTLSAPGQGALYEIITRPAERAGLTFEDGLPARILHDTGSDPGALALMAFALDELYDETIEAGATVLTRAAYTAIGAVQGAIAKRADDAFDALDSDSQAALARVFQELIRIDDRGVPTRARARLAQFDSDAAAHTLIDRFIARRLLIGGSGQDNAPTIEVAHEALFRGWGRLVSWIDEAAGDLRLQDAVRRAAAEWEAHAHNSEYLWSNSRNAEVNAMIARRDWNAGASVLAFIRSESDRFLDEIADRAIAPERRREIGLTLAILGDTRAGVGVRDGVPDIAWVDVISAAGSFQVARYPVTIAQYQAFINDTRGDPRFDPRTATERQFGALRQDVALRSGGTNSNQPITGVTWSEAMLFCTWLADTTGLPVRLPTVNERAAIMARIDLRQTGDNPANTLETGIGIAAVGVFPPDAPDLHDLRGNVCEWGMEAVPPLMYNRTGSPSDDLRPLFGASHGRIAHAVPDVQCADPDLRAAEWGFRVVASAFPVPEYNPPPTPPAGTTLVTRSFQDTRHRSAWHELVRLLPKLRFKQLNTNFQLIPKDDLTALMQTLRSEARRSISSDIDHLEHDLLPLFRQRDYAAAAAQNSFRLGQLGYAVLVIAIIAMGSLALWLVFVNPTLTRFTAPGALALTLSVLYLVTIMKREPAYPRYLDSRRKAEALRREYFRYLARLSPYSQERDAITRRYLLSERAANLNLGTDAAEAGSKTSTAQPMFLANDRETDEALYAIINHHLLNDARIFFIYNIRRYQTVAVQCSLISATSLLVAGITVSLAGVLHVMNSVCDPNDLCSISPILLVISLTAAGIALLFFVMTLVYQFDRLISIFELSLENLEAADAISPLSNEPDDRAFRVELEQYTEAILRVLEDEAAQYGQPTRSPEFFRR
ncbi:MAG: SUMF1/EgtB/PvdO family nonheme iron enzyme [Chloroflexota bacterium]|nr:SUMF1/EgtB/PvdO family nonheme iron enzyme [Chloroflexota bacterium]